MGAIEMSKSLDKYVDRTYTCIMSVFILAAILWGASLGFGFVPLEGEVAHEFTAERKESLTQFGSLVGEVEFIWPVYCYQAEMDPRGWWQGIVVGTAWEPSIKDCVSKYELSPRAPREAVKEVPPQMLTGFDPAARGDWHTAAGFTERGSVQVMWTGAPWAVTVVIVNLQGRPAPSKELD
jgi:hypothetical protein